MVVVSPLVIHFRVSCCALCCTVPVFAEELEYMECFFSLHIPPFPLGGKWISSGLPETTSRRPKNRVGMYSGMYLWSTERWTWSC